MQITRAATAAFHSLFLNPVSLPPSPHRPSCSARLEAALEAERNRVKAEQASFISGLHAEIDELNYRLQKEQESRKVGRLLC